MKFDRGGGVAVFCGATEIGQGSDDVLAGIVAEVLGLDTFDIRLYTGDTDLGPVDLGSYSSRVTIMAGNAALQAAERGKAIIAEAVAEKLEVPKERLRFADKRVFDSAAPEKSVTFPEAVCLGGSALRHDWHGGLLHSAEVCLRFTKAAAWDRRQRTLIPLLSSK